MPRAAPDPELVSAAHELSAAGCSMGDIAETLGVSKPTIARWLKLPKPSASPPPAPAEALPAHMAPAAPPVSVVPLDTTDPRALVRQLIAEQHAAIQADRQVGNMRGASANAATLERLVKSLKQLETASAADDGALHITRDTIYAVKKRMHDVIGGHMARGGVLRCVDCNRALSVTWGLGPQATVATSATQPIIPDPGAK